MPRWRTSHFGFGSSLSRFPSAHVGKFEDETTPTAEILNPTRTALEANLELCREEIMRLRLDRDRLISEGVEKDRIIKKLRVQRKGKTR
jgi:hypothetical protein